MFAVEQKCFSCKEEILDRKRENSQQKKVNHTQAIYTSLLWSESYKRYSDVACSANLICRLFCWKCDSRSCMFAAQINRDSCKPKYYRLLWTRHSPTGVQFASSFCSLRGTALVNIKTKVLTPLVSVNSLIMYQHLVKLRIVDVGKWHSSCPAGFFRSLLFEPCDLGRRPASLHLQHRSTTSDTLMYLSWVWHRTPIPSSWSWLIFLHCSACVMLNFALVGGVQCSWALQNFAFGGFAQMLPILSAQYGSRKSTE